MVQATLMFGVNYFRDVSCPRKLGLTRKRPMPRLLIVEDSPVERIYIQSLLRRQWPSAKISICEDAVSVLPLIEHSLPDLILTDLHLPGGMTGLQLIEEITARELPVPVVLMTGVGSEELAMQAIFAGAANYVPKTRLKDNLVETVDKILRLSRRRTAHQRLLSSVVHQDLRFCLDNDTSLVMPFVELIQQHMAVATRFTSVDATRVGVALSEALTNAINHGNLELDSDLRQEDERIYHALGEKRRVEFPYKDRRTYIAVTMTDEDLDFRIRDEGPGFDTAKVLAKLECPDLDRVGGRGILLIQSFMDTLSFNETGNEIRFSKRALRPAPAAMTETIRPAVTPQLADASP